MKFLRRLFQAMLIFVSFILLILLIASLSNSEMPTLVFLVLLALCIIGIVKLEKLHKNLISSADTNKTKAKTSHNVSNIPKPVKVYRPPVILEGKFLRYYYPRVKICKEKDVSIVDRINVGDWIDLIPEPTNQYDKNAIVVSCRSTNTKLGYIYRGTHQEMCCRWEKNDKLLLSKITEIDSENNVYIYLAFYDTIFQDMYKNRFKVSISENKYFSCNLDKGDEVSILYDFEKDKYSIDDWGTVPKSSKVFFESIGNDNNYVSFIENIEENDSGNYKITVATVYVDDK